MIYSIFVPYHYFDLFFILLKLLIINSILYQNSRVHYIPDYTLVCNSCNNCVVSVYPVWTFSRYQKIYDTTTVYGDQKRREDLKKILLPQGSAKDYEIRCFCFLFINSA